MIETRGLTKRFGRKAAVDDLTFVVEPGRVTGFLGPNGAGKSTTLRMILGLQQPDAGTATVRGRPYRQLANPLRQVGALLDSRDAHGGRTGANHLRCLAESNGIERRRVAEVLDLVGLGAAASKRVRSMSQGMSQRLGIAAALLGDPEVLILDEPVNGLDPEGIRWIRDLMRALAAQGRTVLVSSHLMGEMANTADHLIVIGQGRLLADVPMADLVEGGTGTHVKVHSPQANRLHELLRARGVAALPCAQRDRLEVRGVAAQEVGRIAAEHGIAVYELASHQASLEEAYFELTRSAVEFGARTGDDR